MFIIIIFISACTPSSNLESSQNTIEKGVSLSPRSYSSEDFTSFFAKAQETGTIISWAGDWNELQNVESGAPAVVMVLAETYSYTPIIEVQFFQQSEQKLLRPLNEDNLQSYKELTKEFVKKYNPPYLGIGIEVNILYESSSEDFEIYASFYNQLYDEIKEISPETKVFPIFQLERMKGLKGGLFGGENNEKNNEWDLLTKFPKADAIGFTSYPGLIYSEPTEIPEDYYLEIKNYTNKPIFFTEVGWPASLDIEGWQSSEEEQAAFVERIFLLIKDTNTEFIIWSFLYDQETEEPFKSLGLIDKEGNEKLAFETWKSS